MLRYLAPKASLSAMLCPQPGHKGVVHFKAAKVYLRLERTAFSEVPRRVPIARRFGTFQGVLDHRPAQ